MQSPQPNFNHQHDEQIIWTLPNNHIPCMFVAFPSWDPSTAIGIFVVPDDYVCSEESTLYEYIVHMCCCLMYYYHAALHVDGMSRHAGTCISVKTEKHKELAMMQTMECDSVLVSLGNDTRRAVQRAIDGKTSAWLTVMPIACNHFDLSSVEFRDALSLRYHRPLLKTPGHCDGCGEEFSFQHARDCKKGGLVTQRHNEVQDALGDLAAIVYKDVVREPIVQEADDSRGRPALIADLSIRGVWQPQTAALLDVCVVDTDTQSYASCTVDAVLCSAEQEKKRKYSAAVEDRRASFTPFVVSVDGVLGHDAQHLIKRLCDQIAMKWEKSHSEVMGWVRARMAFAILRATNLCLRGSRVKWRSGHGMDDGAGLPHFPH